MKTAKPKTAGRRSCRFCKMKGSSSSSSKTTKSHYRLLGFALIVRIFVLKYYRNNQNNLIKMREKRPKLVSMEGMIWNANHVMTYALDPGIRGIPKGYFMSCAGVVVMSCLQAGFMFSGSVGTGIFMKRDMEGNWSNPVACGMAGVGVGFQIGATSKDVIIFLPDDESVQALFSKGVKMSAQSDVTVGVGREFEGGVSASGSGVSSMISMAYTKGAFMGASMEGALISPRRGANEAFYGPGNGDPDAIIEGRVAFPIDKVTMFGELKDKLEKLSQGVSEKIGEAEAKKAEQAAIEADKIADSITSASSDIVELK